MILEIESTLLQYRQIYDSSFIFPVNLAYIYYHVFESQTILFISIENKVFCNWTIIYKLP